MRGWNSVLSPPTGVSDGGSIEWRYLSGLSTPPGSDPASSQVASPSSHSHTKIPRFCHEPPSVSASVASMTGPAFSPWSNYIPLHWRGEWPCPTEACTKKDKNPEWISPKLQLITCRCLFHANNSVPEPRGPILESSMRSQSFECDPWFPWSNDR